MCLGTTVACRACQREAILFYPGGRCGEVEPFPSWHRIRGHFRRIRRCHDCIQSHQGALRRERENFIRDSRRAKSLRQYFRGERAHPLPDEEYHLRSQGGYRLERFDLISDVHQPPAEEPTPIQDAAPIDYLGEYQAGRRLHPFNVTTAEVEFLVFQTEEQAHPQDQILALIVQQMEQCVQRQADIDATSQAINGEDQEYGLGQIRFTFDMHQDSYRQIPDIAAERSADILEAESPEGQEEDGDYHAPEPPDIPFYEWTLTSYLQDSTHNVGLSAQDALEADLNNYMWYLSHYGTELQANDFHRHRTQVANRWYDFDDGRLDGPPLSQWLASENQRRAGIGLTHLTCPIQSLELYWQQVLWYECDEVLKAYEASRRLYFEENRRELYGLPRGEHCLLTERLRGVREDTWRVMAWTEHEYPHLVEAQLNLNQICRILTASIAMVMEPTDEQWTRMLELGQEAVREMREALAQGPSSREVSWNAASALLSADSDYPLNTAIGDVDEFGVEGQEPPRVSLSSVGQEPRAESVESGDTCQPRVWATIEAELE